MDLTVDPIVNPAPAATERGAALIWRRRWWVAASSATGMAMAIFVLHTATYRYSATMTVTPVQANSTALPGGLSGLASLAGVQVGRGEVAKPFVLYMQMLTGDGVVARLARDRSLMRHVFAKHWDARLGRWREPESATRGVTNLVKSILGVPVRAWAPPGPPEVDLWLSKRLSVAEDPKNGIARISLSDPDPEFAMATLAKINTLADTELRARELQRTRGYITYLGRTLATVTLAEHRAALAAMLGEQERKRMIAAADTAFAAELLGPIVASDKPDTPQPVATLLVGLGGGLLLGLLLALNWPQQRRRKLR
ncbi:MAG: hypothetical protein DCF31_14180 [Alphaproteobacteria bacterium]|nr:MAG: hypothetical protein DCF31_14180 [Alphaproteobacteria bacterium]